jgi:hypothetical protein
LVVFTDAGQDPANESLLDPEASLGLQPVDLCLQRLDEPFAPGANEQSNDPSLVQVVAFGNAPGF